MDIATLTGKVEGVSAFYAERHDIERTDDWFVLKLGEEVGELMQAYLARSGQTRDKGRSPGQLEDDIRDELADVLAQLLLISKHFDVDLDDAIAEEMARPEAAVVVRERSPTHINFPDRAMPASGSTPA